MTPWRDDLSQLLKRLSNSLIILCALRALRGLIIRPVMLNAKLNPLGQRHLPGPVDSAGLPAHVGLPGMSGDPHYRTVSWT